MIKVQDTQSITEHITLVDSYITFVQRQAMQWPGNICRLIYGVKK